MEEMIMAIENALAATGLLRYTGMDCGQLDEEQPSVAWPCALIELDDIEWSDTAGHRQIGVATLRVTVADTIATRASQRNPRLMAGLGALRLIEPVQAALHCLRGNSFGPLTVTGVRPGTSGRGFNSYSLTLSARLERGAAATTVRVTGVAGKPADHNSVNLELEIDDPQKTAEKS